MPFHNNTNNKSVHQFQIVELKALKKNYLVPTADTFRPKTVLTFPIAYDKQIRYWVPFKQGLSENKVVLKLKNRGTSLFDLRQIEWARAFFTESICIRTSLSPSMLLFTVQMNCSPVYVHLCCKSWRDPGIIRGLESKIIMTNERPASWSASTHHTPTHIET